MSFDAAALDSGQAQQVAAMRALQDQGVAIGGWKLGQTSGGSRDAFGAGYRAFGYVREDRILHSGDTLAWARMQPGGIETEIAFLLDDDLDGTATAQTARAAVRMAPGFELNQSRLQASASHAERIADDLSNWGIVVGAPIAVPQDWEPEELVVSIHEGGTQVNEVAAQGHIDDHFESLAMLARKLAAHGLRLQRGDWVITGAFGRVKEPAAGVWHGDFAGIGRVSLNIER